MRTHLLFLRAVPAIVIATALLAAPAGANHRNYDAFNHEVINPVPYQGGVQRTFEVAPIDTTSYTYDDGVSEPAACSDNFGKTAWVRFNSAVAGRLDVQAVANFNVILYAHELKPSAIGTANPSFTDIQDLLVAPPGQAPRSGSCNAASSGNTETLDFLRVNPNLPVWVQVGGFCSLAGNPCTNRDTTPPTQSGIISTLRLIFTPDDADNDDVADTLDLCKGLAGDAPNGCLRDDDGDRVPDRSDACKGITGDLPNGCLRDTDRDQVPDKSESDACRRRPGERADGCPRALEATFRLCFNNLRSYSLILKRRPKECGRRGKSGFLLRVSPKLAGTKIKFRCRPVRKCPVDDVGGRALNARALRVLRSQLVNERFRRGARLEFFITRENTWGAYRRWQVRGGRKPPRLTSACLDSMSGVRRPLADCSL